MSTTIYYVCIYVYIYIYMHTIMYTRRARTSSASSCTSRRQMANKQTTYTRQQRGTVYNSNTNSNQTNKQTNITNILTT